MSIRCQQKVEIHNPQNNILKKICGALPSGTVASVSANGNLTGVTGSFDLVMNFSNGEVSGYASPGYFIGPTGAGTTVTGGYTFGDLGPGNTKLSGGFTGAFGGGGIFAGSVATSSAGPMSPISGISPGIAGHVATAQFGLHTPGRGVAAISTFSFGEKILINTGRSWIQLLLPPTQLKKPAKQQAISEASDERMPVRFIALAVLILGLWEMRIKRELTNDGFRIAREQG